MFRILKNMKPYWKGVVLAVLLLIIQAFCDLALPNYTSDIIDVGIQNSGIEYCTPTVISGEQYAAVGAFMTDDELSLWTDSYELDENDGCYYIKDDSDENLEKLDETFTEPIVVTYMIEQAAKTQTEDSQLQMQMSDDAQASGENPMLAIREKMSDELSVMGDSMLHSSAIAFTTAEYESVGKDTEEIQTNYLWREGGQMLAIALVMTVVSILVGFIASKVGAAVGRDLRGKVFDKVTGFSNAEINKFSTATLITRSTNDIQQVQMVSTMLLRMLLYAPILAVGGVIMVIRTGAGMWWIIAVSVLALLCIVGALMAVAMPKFKLMQVLVDKVNLVSREILTGLNVIRAFSREKLEEKRFDKANTELTKTMLFTNRVMSLMMPVMMLLMNGISVLIVWVSAHKIDSGNLEVGSMTAFITYTMMIVMSFLMLTMMSIVLPRASVAAGRIDEVLNTDIIIADKANPLDVTGCKGEIEFKHVYFKYPGGEDYALKDISFVAKPGETTAIIGSTGCGKSTLIQLIPRLYDVTDGNITIDGNDIRDVSQSSLREEIGFVPQKGVLFSGTIESNLRYGAENASAEEIEQAAEIAQATEFINEKSDKMASSISQGGGNVSGGQKQRLSIARAIAKNPKIFIFDDSFSALDFKTDVKLRKALAQKVSDATMIIVAQRISTVLQADRIVVLDDGEIVGIGRHSELMKSCEVYQQIARSQLSEKELNDNAGGKEAL